MRYEHADYLHSLSFIAPLSHIEGLTALMPMTSYVLISTHFKTALLSHYCLTYQ